MSEQRSVELPQELRPHLTRAKRLAWLTITFLVSDMVFLYLVMSGSQAATAVFFEAALALTPSIVFLLALPFRDRPPSKEFPFGFHRVTSVAYLVAGVALLALGAYLLYDSIVSLLQSHHPSIGGIEIFGVWIWRGWLIIAAVAYSGVAFFLGRAKMPHARALHDKVLYASAEMNRADWMTSAAAIVGLLGVAYGLWWMDAVAAGLISLDIVRDGFKNTRIAVYDLMDKEPTTLGREKEDPLLGRVRQTLRDLPWVGASEVRAREEGRVFFFEASVVPREKVDLLPRLEEAREQIHALDWRVKHVHIMPVTSLDEDV